MTESRNKSGVLTKTWPKLDREMGSISRVVYDRPIDLGGKKIGITQLREVDRAICEAMLKYGITRPNVIMADYRWFVEWWLMCTHGRSSPYLNSFHQLLNELCNHTPVQATQEISIRVEQLCVRCSECV